MARFNPLDAVGLLLKVNPDSEDSWFFLGSCFAFRERRSFLTAAHCIGDLEAGDLRIHVPRVMRPPQPVTEVLRHPAADLALLRVREASAQGVEAFWNFVGNYGWGEEFAAYGYAEDLGRRADTAPTARLFKGHYQRFWEHRSFASYRYEAGEMSIPSPPGLSGGPLFRPGAPQMVTALAAENVDSTTTLEALEETREEGETRTTHYQRVISYGLAVTLHPLGDWLDEHLAPFDSTAWAERQRRDHQ